jgi:transketolase
MSTLHLADLTSGDIKMEAIRKGFGRGLLEAGKQNDQVVALCADLTGSTQIQLFAEAFPERYIEVGIAEQNLVTVAAGMAAMGKIPFTSSYAAFSPGRNWEQFKTTACLNNVPVKIVGSHAGLYTGPDGATHQMLEDIALMRVLPNNVVIVPCDSIEAQKATLALAADPRPGYIRVARDSSAVITTEKTPFEIGKAQVFSAGKDVTIIACGTMVAQALEAAELLYRDGIDAEIINMATIKPFDSVTVLQSARKTGAVITVEEAQINGGLGSAVAECLAENLPMPLIRMGVKDRFGESGTPAELLNFFGLTGKHIAMQAHALLKKK